MATILKTLERALKAIACACSEDPYVGLPGLVPWRTGSRHRGSAGSSR